ncbi:hypothetical protein U9M48_030705 [Paspalum notatum var. saurae]|uniref:CCHC-type domain-containing protein n=1 Tax=Paspalum notatum var. saurae TaxID=547442 RepID=A0AAQ3U1F8_PASNO
MAKGGVTMAGPAAAAAAAAAFEPNGNEVNKVETVERKVTLIRLNGPPWPLINSLGQHWPGGKVTVKLTEGKLPGKDSWKTSANIMFQKLREISRRKNSEAEANTMTMQEYIEKFTTRPVMHRKKSTLILRSATPSFATLINRVIQIEEDKREEKSQLKRKFMEIKSQRQERRFRQKSFGGQVSRGSYGVPPRNTISNPSRFAPTQSSYQTQQYDPRTCFKCGKPGHFQFNCPQPMRPAASTFSNSVNGPKQTSATGNRPTTSTQSGKPPLPPANRARINHVEAQEARGLPVWLSVSSW